LCLSPFTKVSGIITESQGQTALMKLRRVRVAASTLASHRWGMDQLKTVEPLMFGARKIHILLSEDSVTATELFLQIDSKLKHHFSVQRDKEFKVPEFIKFLKEGSHIKFALFEDSLTFALELDHIISTMATVDSNDDSRLFLLVDTSSDFASHVICARQLWTIE
jgi:hypothetical protein